MAAPFPVTDQEFQEKVLDSDMLTITDFWATWCAPCRLIAPLLEDIAEEYDGQLQVAKMDVDYNPQTAGAYGVMSIPTLILFKDGQPVDRLVGYMPKDRLMNRIAPHLA